MSSELIKELETLKSVISDNETLECCSMDYERILKDFAELIEGSSYSDTTEQRNEENEIVYCLRCNPFVENDWYIEERVISDIFIFKSYLILGTKKEKSEEKEFDIFDTTAFSTKEKAEKELTKHNN